MKTMTAAEMISRYETKRAAANKPVRVSHLGNGRYYVAPLLGTNVPVGYTITGSELRARLDS